MSQNRRQFLSECGQTAAALGSVALFGAVSVGNEGTRALGRQTIRLGVIGVGGRGSYLMNRMLSQKKVRITAVCDVNQRHLDRAVLTLNKRQKGKVERHGDFRRLLADRSIDAVIVATPHHWHCGIALRALAEGKHVYLEKPASHVFREGRLLVEAARKHKWIVQHGTQMRSSEVTAAAGKVLRSGILGEIKQAKAWGVEPRAHHPQPAPNQPPPEGLNYDAWLGPAPKRPFNPQRFRRWNSFRDYGNGEIGGDGIHDIDMARWGLGVTTHPVQITAHGSRIHLTGESDFPDNMLVTFQYAEGKVLIYENRNFAPYKMHGWDNGNVFYGTDGYMVFSRRGYFQTYLGKTEKKGPGMRGGAGIDEHIGNFLACVRSGKPNNADAETAHLSCALVHLGEIAYRTGRVLHFDAKTESFTNHPTSGVLRPDEQANALLTKKYRKPWGID